MEEEVIAEVMKVPTLRFPEFDGEWTLHKFGSVTKRVSDPVKVEDETLYKQIGIRSHCKGIFHKELVTGKSLGNKRVFWVKENALVVNIVFAWEQAVAKTSDKELGLIASHRFPMYVPFMNQSDISYLLYFFTTKKGKFLLGLASPGGAGRNKTLGQKEFENLKFYIPRLSEQQKIASFLTSVENKIQLLIKKKSLLEKYKKGVVHQIFSQQIRFKDENGQHFPDWQEKELKGVAKIMYGKDQKKVLDINGKYPILGTGGLMGWANAYLYSKPSVLIGRKGTIDKPVYIDTPFWTVDTLYYTEVMANTYPKWLFFKFQTINWKLYNEASGVPSLSASTINKIKIELPSVPEQTKIAEFLTAIDAKISLVVKQLEQAQQFKKGLLQQMFV